MIRLAELGAWVCLVVAVVSTMAGAEVQPRQLLDRSNRFLDKPWPKAELTPSVVPADSFEDLDSITRDWKATNATFEVSTEHVTDGKQSLKVVFPDAKASLGYRRGTAGWGNTTPGDVEIPGLRALHYDELRLDVFNPGQETQLLVTAANNQARLSLPLKPGANALVIPTADLRKESYRVSEIAGSLTFSLPGITQSTTLFLDNLRWIGPGLGRNLIAYGKCFDFGEPYAVRPFFLNVDATTAYTRERGYGWLAPTTSPSQPSPPVAAGHLTARRPDDELLWDFITSARTPFLVDLPAGRYRLQVVEHGIGFYEQSPAFYDLTVKVNDGEPQLLRQRAGSFAEATQFEYGLDQTDWLPGDDLWKKYRGHLVRPLEMDFDSQGGQARIEFATGPRGFENLSFLILYPVDKADVIEPELAALWQDLRYRFNEAFAPATLTMAQSMHLPGLHPELQPTIRAQRLADLAPTEPEKQHGFILFDRDGMEELYPDSVPARSECSADYATAGPPGEIESLAVNLLALRDLSQVRLEVGDFVGPNGTRIAADRADVRVVNCIPRMTGQQSHGDWRFMILPWNLVKRPAVDVPGQTCRRWWINVEIPSDAAPGSYTASAVLQAKDLPRREIKLKLEVLPFRLDPLPNDIEQSMVVVWPHWYVPLSDRLWFFIKTWVIYSNPANFQKPENAPYQAMYEEAQRLLLDRRKAELELIRHYGFNFAYVNPLNVDKSVVDALKAQSIPGLDLYWYSNPTWKEQAAELATKKVFTSGENTPALESQTEEAISKLRQQKGLPVILSMNSELFFWSDVQQEAGIYRFEAGFLLHRLGANGGAYGPWYMPWRDPYNPTDGHVGEWGDFVDPASTGPQPAMNPTLIFEGLRQGIQDYRYLAMLQRLVQAKPASSAAQEAQAYLTSLRDRIQPTAAAYFEKVGRRGGWDNTWTQKNTTWKGRDYRDARRQIAELIAKLQPQVGQ